jgi:hypothetical protein
MQRNVNSPAEWTGVQLGLKHYGAQDCQLV